MLRLFMILMKRCQSYVVGVSFVWLIAGCMGCGTTRSSNTQRTATEQLLISDAIDRTVQKINFSPMAGKSVYFDESKLQQVVDQSYLVSSLRQHLLASGCILKDTREEADFIVEARAGAVGTDNHDLLFGVPATNIPQLTLISGLPPALPELPIAKRRNQRGVAKIAVFAYRRQSGDPVWQSGIALSESTSNDTWILGAGPIKRGTIHKGTIFAGRRFSKQKQEEDKKSTLVVRIDKEAIFEAELGQQHSSQHNAVQQATAIETLQSGRSPTNQGPRVLPPPLSGSP